ncbi:MAG: NUDIX hydrolase [Aestuariivirga sp.]|uniref:NUDIX hydrolase n=1 Tax=Aestuariivirga sp. TaxID=2650926 RepID=UPI0025C35C47|nr:NUDIX hydrolase [Aestuariivirga sp.]MCA3560372.1 NUDIX hydrolase [Aestuariivirga sp.]
MAIQTQSPGFRRKVPVGDSHERDVCDTCGFVNYVNPKIVTGSIVRHGGKIMLCRRAIEPRAGFWTLPAGFMELGETAEQAAMREAREEANAAIVIDRLLAVYTIPRIAQVQIMYLAHLAEPSFSPGPESLEVMMVGWDGIPWEEIAFPSVTWALEQYLSVEGVADFAPFSNPA